MFKQKRPVNRLQTALSMAELTFHTAAHSVRKSHTNAFMSILINMVQIGVMMLVFYLFYAVLGFTRSSIRGDFMLFLLSGVFIYMTHVRTLGAVAGSAGPTSPMMQHAPMNTLISICAGALSSIYVQVLSLFIILFGYYVIVTPFTIYKPIPAFGCILLAWFYGISVGLCFKALTPWFPTLAGILQTFYTRVNMLASGKMFLANDLPASMRAVFDWNPLFHIIDQARGFIFINYHPQYTSLSYAFEVSLALFCLGLIAEFYTSRHASFSWGARR